MARYKKQMWSGDAPEPFGFHDAEDPNKGFRGEVGASVDFGAKLTQAIKNWLADKKVPFDSVVDSLRKEWYRLGGERANFDRMLEMAFVRSGYYREMMK